MLIKKVELRNFRNHTQFEVNFQKGINLLLGKNGSGKSSILEAIGLTLFGADLRSSLKDAIKKGEKTSYIRIEFIDNSGNLYITEKTLGSQSKQYLVSSDGKLQIENQNQVLQKIAKLTGIEINTKNIFQDVVSAYQNQFTNIFAGSDKSRQEVFNRIFNTEIYREIYDSYSKTVSDRYWIEKESYKKDLEFYVNKIKDIELLNNELKDIIDNFTIQKIEIEKLNEKINKLENEKKELENLKNKIVISKQNIENLQDKIKDRLNQKEKIEKEIEYAQKAEIVIKENQKSYEEYIKYSDELTAINSDINKLEKLEKNKTDLEQMNTRLNNDLVKSQSEKESIEKRIIEKTNDLLKIKQEIDTHKIHLDQKNKESQEILKNKEDLEKHYSQYNQKYLQLLEIEREIEKAQIVITEKEKQKIDLIHIEDQLKSLSIQKENLDQQESAKKKLEQDISRINERLRENELAFQKLSDGKCPYLKEECLNIKEGISIDQYFIQRKISLENELKVLNDKLSMYQNFDKELKKYNEDKAKLEKTKSDSEIILNELVKINTHKELLLRDKKIKTYELKELGKLFSADIYDLIYSDNYEDANEKIKNRISNFDIKLSALKATITEVKNNLSKAEINQKEIEREVSENQKRILELQESIKKLQNNIKLRYEKIEELNIQTLELSSKKEKREFLNKELEKLKLSYNEYLKNEQKAKDLDKFYKQKIENENELNESEKEKKAEEIKLTELTRVFNDEALNQVKETLEQSRSEKEKALLKLSELKYQKENKQKEIEENQKYQEEIDKLSETIALIEQKIKLTEVFRNNIKVMGKLVANRLLEKIERLATENYRLISGKSEYINWINDETTSYKVYLRSETEEINSRAFEILSGGEQVMVALALRSAMASLLTKAQFAIFDEPTINLDTERRIALAESLKFMLNKLHQAIIVTHDDTFSNMANNIIQIGS